MAAFRKSVVERMLALNDYLESHRYGFTRRQLLAADDAADLVAYYPNLHNVSSPGARKFFRDIDAFEAAGRLVKIKLGVTQETAFGSKHGRTGGYELLFIHAKFEHLRREEID